MVGRLRDTPPAPLPSFCRPGTGCSARPSLCLQVVEKGGPYPLIVLPQFGGYWIEGTNHEITSIPETELLQSPTTKVKLECNHTARLYRKHFLGKVGWPSGLGVPGWVRRGSPRSPGGGGWAGQPSRESREHVSWIRSFNQQTRMAPRRHDGVVVSRVCL